MSLTYTAVGATDPAVESWTRPTGFRCHEETLLVADHEDAWSSAVRALMSWAVKTRSGFTVEPPEVRLGHEPVLVAHFGPLRIREPVRVVSVVDEPHRQGFAYGTLEGHPVSGEEAFIVHRDHNGAVFLTLRSITRAAPGPWRIAFPVVLVAQQVYRRRYRRSLP